MNWVELILTIGAFNGFLIGIILMTMKNANRTATVIFGVIVLLFALLVVEELAEYKGWVFQYPRLLNIADSFSLLIAPLIWLYAVLITEKKKKLGKWDLFHFIPFLAFIGYLLPYYFMPDQMKLQRLNYDPSGWVNGVKAFVTAVYIFYSLWYMVRFVRLRKGKDFPENNRQNIYWYRGLLVALASLGVLVLVLTILFNSDVALPLDPDTFSVLFISFLFYALSVRLMRNPFLFWNLQELEAASQAYFVKPEPPSTRYKTSPLQPNDMEQYLQKLRAIMGEQEPYLNPALSPADLEALSGIKAYYISQVLSEVLNRNFYEFVNAYRVDHFKKLVENGEAEYKTLLALGLDSGFNSKSSFNRVFKQFTGSTPSQYSRSLKK